MKGLSFRSSRSQAALHQVAVGGEVVQLFSLSALNEELLLAVFKKRKLATWEFTTHLAFLPTSQF